MSQFAAVKISKDYLKDLYDLYINSNNDLERCKIVLELACRNLENIYQERKNISRYNNL